MRRGLILAAALTALSATGARADQWCGYTAHDDAVIECGYTTAAQCETAVGKADKKTLRARYWAGRDRLVN